MSDSKLSRLSEEQYFELVRMDNARKEKEFEDIKKSVAESDVTLSDELFERLLRLFPTKVVSVMRGHAGFVLAERREHFFTSLSIMYRCLDDLDAALVSFGEQATEHHADIMLPKNKQKLEAIELQIQKELFATANATASLVDHVRRLQKKFEFPEFRSQLQICFQADGLHELIIGLRVLLHHLHIVEAGWSITSDFTTGTKSAGFKIDREELERAIDQSGGFGAEQLRLMRLFVQSCPEQIDLRELFSSYRQRLEKFYGWLRHQVDTSLSEALKDYDRCISEKDRRSTRMTYNALVGNFLNWEKAPDLHKHIPDYLTDEQLREVYALPRNSPEQIDLIIQYIDTLGAVDESLRNRIHQLFQKLSAQEAVSDS